MMSFQDFLNGIQTDYVLNIKKTDGCFIIKNSGRRGEPKDFVLPVESIISSLQTIYQNLNSFCRTYDENNWRDCAKFFDDNVIKSFCGVQTRPFFETINKLLTWISGEQYQDGEMPLTQENIKKLMGEMQKMDFLFPRTSSPSISHPHNRIVFGAPGTGKSHLLNENAKMYFMNENIERVTFHPNYSYAQFVGSYKPFMASDTKRDKLSDNEKQILDILTDNSKSGQEKYDLLYPYFKEENSLTRLPLLLGLYSDDSFKTKKQDGTAAVNDNTVERNHGRAIRPYVNLAKSQIESEQITYQYVPGPFIRIYSKAKKNPKKNYLLIIEEINRANVAAVFGDVFQLLDRKSDGESEYKIAVSEDIKKYLAKNGIYEDELSIPSNMYIWATMNSADQGVFPMDTAFKRRWEFEYIGIDENEEGVKEFEIPINSNQKINWNELRKAINDKLIELSVNEDKLLGPFFLSKNILENAMKDIESFIKLFKSKVIMYLFEDAAKLKVKQLFKIDSSKYIFSEICKQFDEKGLDIFQIDALEIKISNINDTKKEGSVSEGNSETVSLA